MKYYVAIVPKAEPDADSEWMTLNITTKDYDKISRTRKFQKATDILESYIPYDNFFIVKYQRQPPK